MRLSDRWSLSGYGPYRVSFSALAAALLVLVLGTGGTPAAEPVRLLALGDSLTAGYGLAEEEGFTEQLEAALEGRGHEVEVINGGVSGDTTAGGLARLDWALADQPDAVIMALGANDGLRGIDQAETRANLDAILEEMTWRGLPVQLVGMLAPRNLSPEYVEAFDAICQDLAAKHDVPLYPFFLEGVALDPALNQDDGIHPNARGVARVVESILPQVEAILAEAAG